MSSRKHHHKKQRIELLDRFSAQDIRKWEEIKDRVLRFHWEYYDSLAYQRWKIADELKAALLEATEHFNFSRWQRVVKYKYALEPLSVRGSLVDPGGRFNIGDIAPTRFPVFPALYLAADKDTALQETLCQKIEKGKETSALDFALAQPDSISIVSMSGILESVVNLRQPTRLKKFVSLIKRFTLPDDLNHEAREIGLPEPSLIRTVPELLKTLRTPDWREWPMQFDVPAPSQIFGQLVSEAGIEGIFYPSKFTGKECLAIFPHNFESSEVYVEIDDIPPLQTKLCRLDAKNYRTALELTEHS